MHFIRPLVLLLLLAIVTAVTLDLCRIDKSRSQARADLVELSAIRYGLFNVDEWKTILAGILTRRIEELDFTPQQRAEARKKISAFLYATIEDFESRYYKQKGSSITGLLQSSVAWLTGTFDQIKKDVPVFTEQILDFLAQSDNRNQIRGFVLDKLSDYADKTFSRTDYTTRDEILARRGFETVVQARECLAADIRADDDRIRTRGIILVAALLAIAMWWLLMRSVPAWEYALGVVICLVLLAGGLLLPMIEIDARILELQFSLLGEEITFTDQVLYYRSKSILEVVALMIGQGKADILAVGMLVLLFSVLFPIAKLLASLGVILRPAAAGSPWVRFLVFRTGKWSMADVMVVAIFMSYIGFSGILTEQLRQLERMTPTLDIVTTNQSSLQTGFFLFTAFAVFSLLIAHRLEYRRQPSPS